jgi:Uma2 family endonuclease
MRLPDDDFRYEIIEGELYVSPSPSTGHQIAVSSLQAEMHHHARRHKLGTVLTSPIGVLLPGRRTTVQPDVLFIGRERSEIIKDDVIDGAPDLVVEVLSPSNWIYDRSHKQAAYQRAGVREYWIVDYRTQTIDVLVLDEGEYVQRGHYAEGDVAISEVLSGFSVSVVDVFAR